MPSKGEGQTDRERVGDGEREYGVRVTVDSCLGHIDTGGQHFMPLIKGNNLG